ICIGLAVPALAETRGEVRQTTRELLKAQKYRELEALVARLRAEPFAVTERNPKLEAFYGALDLSSKASEKSWLARGKELEAWGVAVPDSVAAKTLLADWWTGYAWKARGTGWARTVTDEG